LANIKIVGGTTKRLIETIRDLGPRVEYTFTDISPTLVNRASKIINRYKGVNMKFMTLNIESEPPVQMRGNYDLVISTNCIHATRSKVYALRNIEKLLNVEGFVILSEVVEIIDWYDIVYGLLEGWWLGEDETYPLQPPEVWMRCFTKAGLEAIYSQGLSRDLNTQRLLVGSRRHRSLSTTQPRLTNYRIQTVTYKEVDGIEIQADVYLPRQVPSDTLAVGMCSQLLHSHIRG
jgi:SAM-dependent methyltransferase